MNEMKVISDVEFSDFLVNKPLYYKVKATENFINKGKTYSNYDDFEGKAFRFKCPREKEHHTFRTSLNGNIERRFSVPGDPLYSFDTLPPFFDADTLMLNITFMLTASCQSCGEKIFFLIRSYSDKSFEKRSEGINIYIEKAGQFPAFDIEPDKTVQKYLTEEDKKNYKKALTNLSVSYGIGAFAYFRRIIENEIKRIIKDLSELNFEGSEKIKIAYKNFETDHQMNKLIQSITPHLPSSLLTNGENTIKLLYEQLSGGIHTFPEEICLKKSEQINVLLPYVIKKVNEEKFQINDIKQAIKNLKN